MKDACLISEKRAAVRHLLSASAFLLILALLIAGASCVVRPKNNTAEAGMQNLHASGILAEPDNTIDVVFLGNSLCNCGLMPMEIWKNYGIACYNCGSAPQRMYLAEELLHTAFRRQHPRMVVMEPLALFEDYGSLEVLPEKAQRYLPVLRYHNRWKSLRPEDWYAPVRYTGINPRKGYVERRETVPADVDSIMPMIQRYSRIPRKNAKILRRMRDFCRENGAELVFISTPSLCSWSQPRFDAVQAMADALEIPYLNMENDIPGEAFIDWQTDTYDGGDHMNLTGAIKVSDYLGSWLSDTGLFQDRRGDPAYADWNETLAQFERSHPENAPEEDRTA